MTISVFSSNRTTIFWYVSIYACFDGFRQHRASTSRVSRGSLRLWVFTCTRIRDIQPLFTIFLSTTACTASAVVLHGGSCKCVLRKQVFNGLNRKGAFVEFFVRCHPWCFVGLLQQQIIFLCSDFLVHCKPAHLSRLLIFELHFLAFHLPSSQSCGVRAWRHEQCIFIESHYQLPAIRRVESMFLASMINLFVRLLSRLSVLLDSPWRMCPSQLSVQMMFLLRSQRALDGMILSQGQDFQHFPVMRPRPYWIE